MWGSSMNKEGACTTCEKTSELVAKGMCWACYQRDRRSKLERKVTPACIEGRRYHSYDENDRCKLCGSKRLFAN